LGDNASAGQLKIGLPIGFDIVYLSGWSMTLSETPEEAVYGAP